MNYHKLCLVMSFVLLGVILVTAVTEIYDLIYLFFPLLALAFYFSMKDDRQTAKEYELKNCGGNKLET